jgi:hypothetical protein
MFPTAVLKATLEESADRKQEIIFVAAGFVGREDFWTKFESEWRTKLDDGGIKYYKTSHWKHLKGQFEGLERSAADKIRADLQAVIQSNRIIAFGLGIIMKDYNKVRSEMPEAIFFYEDDPSVPAFYHLMDVMNRTVRKKAKGCSIRFIYDDSSKSAKISHAFESLRKVHPIVGKTLETLAPFDDKEHPSLQATDLLAEVTKGVFTEWLAEGRPQTVPIPNGWEQNMEPCLVMDERYLRHEIAKTLASPKFMKGLLPVRPVGRQQQRRNKAKMSERQEK